MSLAPAAPDPRKVAAALGLLRLGVSNARVNELLSYDIGVIERQLEWLPYRKAKRPEALIIDAIRNNYSPPKEVYYAPPQTQPAPAEGQLDDGAESGA